MNAPVTAITDTTKQLILAAERLYACEGLDVVSARQIAEAAGQKNISSVKYHFGGKEGLLRAILGYRLKTIQQNRQVIFNDLLAEGRETDLRSLVEVLVKPYSDLLLVPLDEHYYLQLIPQLYAQPVTRQLVREVSGQVGLMQALGQYIRQCLADVPSPLLEERMAMMAIQIIQVVANWDNERRENEQLMTEKQLAAKTSILIDFIVAGVSGSAMDS